MPQTTIGTLRNVRHAFDNARGAYVFCWANGNALFYSITSRVEDFSHVLGVQVKASVVTVPTSGSSTAPVFSTPRDIYGAPISMRFRGNRLEVRYTNLATINTNVTQRVTGDMLIGTYDDTDTAQIIWESVAAEPIVHSPSLPVLEITESRDDGIIPTNGGVLAVQYERDSTGSIIVDANGCPKISLIDDSGSTGGDNLKTGRIVLPFLPDYFGSGNHAWGVATAIHRPFDVVFLTPATASTPGTFMLWPGKVNQGLPTNMFEVFPYVYSTTRYVKLSCDTNGRIVTMAEIISDAALPDPIFATEGVAQSNFDVLLAVIVNGVVYDMWSGEHIAASVSQAFVVDKIPTQPGETSFNRWFTWSVATSS